MWTTSLSSDTVLASLLPLTILVLGFRFFPISKSELVDILSFRQKSHYGPFSLQRAIQSYNRYPYLAEAELSRMRVSYAKLGRAHKRIGYHIGYPKKLDWLKDVTDQNSKLTRGIAELARKEYKSKLDPKSYGSVDHGDLGRTRESLRHFVRDWSEQGRHERDKIFTPILEVLRNVNIEQRSNMRVLVPGSGLGRLAWEISELGFNTTANEISFFMTLAFHFLLSPSATTRKHQHTIYPYAHWFSHQRTNDALFRAITFPDALPRLSSSLQFAPVDFLSLKPPVDRLGHVELAGYDFIVTAFFIDTAVNVLATLDQIYALLRPGGCWINIGPLLWLGGAQARVELSLEEVLLAAETLGLVIERDSAKSVECEYTADEEAMMRWVYKTEFWVARKSK